ADCEGITLEKAPEMLRLYREGGWPAVARWVQEQRGGTEASPYIKPVAEKMRAADAMRAENAALRARLDALVTAARNLVNCQESEAFTKVLTAALAEAKPAREVQDG